MDKDLITKPIYREIKEPIQILFEKKFASFVPALVFIGMDTLANLSRPIDKNSVTRSDFKKWVDRYLKINDPEKVLTSADWYSSRCATLHTSTQESSDSKSGDAKRISFAYEGNTKNIHHSRKKAISYDAKIDPVWAIVSMDCLIQAFFEGIDQFIVDILSNKALESVLEERVRAIAIAVPVNP